MTDASTTNNPALSVDLERRGSGQTTLTPIKPLQLDPEKYRSHLEDFDMSQEQQDEMLLAIWNILSTMVDIGFGLDSVQMFCLASDKNGVQDSGNHIVIDNASAFNKVADKTLQEGKDYE